MLFASVLKYVTYAKLISWICDNNMESSLPYSHLTGFFSFKGYVINRFLAQPLSPVVVNTWSGSSTVLKLETQNLTSVRWRYFHHLILWQGYYQKVSTISHIHETEKFTIENGLKNSLLFFDAPVSCSPNRRWGHSVNYSQLDVIFMNNPIIILIQNFQLSLWLLELYLSLNSNIST